MVSVIHIAKYHPAPNVIKKCLIQVVRTFSKYCLTPRTHEKEHFTPYSCLSRETSIENVPLRFGQSQTGRAGDRMGTGRGPAALCRLAPRPGSATGPSAPEGLRRRCSGRRCRCSLKGLSGLTKMDFETGKDHLLLHRER